ncbi:MAG: D-alanine--D-alanine ligase [Candidatus Pacebacteria bacterium]|nr:D-alanine--D-alanine ligase [Candidatus Paceibacterota bacterium]
MQRIKVAVLRGGPSRESEISFKTGKNVLDNLSDKYIPTDVFISKDGGWYVDGIPVSPQKLFQNIDVVFNALHGEYGEDGKVQQLMNQFGVKYTGSKALASALGMNKAMAKDFFKKAGLKTPVYVLVKKEDNLEEKAKEIFRTFPIPAIVKPNGSGSSLGVTIVKTMKDILPAIEEALKHSEYAIVEEFIEGKEATCGVIEDFREKSIYPLLPIEIVKPREIGVWGFTEKYSGCSEEKCPGSFSDKEKEMIQNMTVEAHRVLGLKHYSRSDFIISPKRGVYILEVNSLPGLTKESLLPKSLEAVGCSFSYFLDHIITLALNGDKDKFADD